MFINKNMEVIMALSDMKSSQAIITAIKEFKHLGRETFLNKYGFGHARQYFLDYENQLYDSKAIIGVAHGFEFPGQGILKPIEFSGGKLTVCRKLEELGFKVCELPKKNIF